MGREAIKIKLGAKDKELERIQTAYETARKAALQDPTDELLAALGHAEDALNVATKERNQLAREYDGARDAEVDRFLLSGHAGGHPLVDDRRWSSAALQQMGERGLDRKAFPGGAFTVPPVLDSSVVQLGVRPQWIRQLLPVETIEGTDRFSFIQQTARGANAGAVAAGGLKPTSSPNVARVEQSVSVVATMSDPLDRSLLMDVDTLQPFLDSELRIDVLLAEDAQLLSGDGIAPNQRGILNTVGIGTLARGADPRSDAIRKAIKVLRLAQLVADAVIMHPTDWLTTSLEKDANGNYMYGRPNAPMDLSEQRIWGLPVVESDAITAGTALVGAFRTSAKFFERESMTVEFSQQGAPLGVDLFSHNQFIARCEERIGLGVLRPAGFCTVTGM